MVKCSTDYEKEVDEYSKSGLSPLSSKKSNHLLFPNQKSV